MDLIKTISPKELDQKISDYGSKLCSVLEALNSKHSATFRDSKIDPVEPMWPLKGLQSSFSFNLANTLCERLSLKLDE